VAKAATPESWIPVASATPPDPETIPFAQRFAAVARAIDKCENATEAVTLLLSTCRNQYLTTNAIFLDVRDVVLASEGQGSPLTRAAAAVERGGQPPTGVKTHLQPVRQTLSIAGQKFDVWGDRLGLIQKYRDAVDALRDEDAAAGDQARLALDAALHRTEGDALVSAAYFRIDPDETVSRPQLDELQRLERALWHATDLLMVVESRPPATFAPVDGGLQFEVADQPNPELASEIIYVLRKGQAASSWTLGEDGGGVRVTSLLGHACDFEVSATSLALELRRTVFDLVVALENAVRERLATTFLNNSARRSLPAPFVIDVTPRELQLPERQGTTIQTSVEPPPGSLANHARVALMEVVIPGEWLSRADHLAYEVKYVDPIIATCVDALTQCQKEGIDLLVLPELFVPRAGLQVIKETADRLGVGVIGGLEGRAAPDGKSVNEAMIKLPGQYDLELGKQRPSVFEEREEFFESTGKMHHLRDTVLGNLVVVICSDYLEADLISLLGEDGQKGPHTLVVCARNPSSGVFEALAQADAIRLFANVMVANSTSEATEEPTAFAKRPTRVWHHKPITLPKIMPGLDDQPLLRVYDVDIAGVRARSLRGSPEHWLPASIFARER
jgi:hypothetical protein